MADSSKSVTAQVSGNQAVKFSDDLWDLTDIARGTILDSWYDEGVKVVVMRGGASFCVYLGIATGHPLAGFDYDSMPLDCHGGLTFAAEGDDKYLPKGFYYYGWDYAHAGDYVDFYSYPGKIPAPVFEDDKKWTLKEVKQDLEWNGLYGFHKLVGLAEKIARKGYTSEASKAQESATTGEITNGGE